MSTPETKVPKAKRAAIESAVNAIVAGQAFTIEDVIPASGATPAQIRAVVAGMRAVRANGDGYVKRGRSVPAESEADRVRREQHERAMAVMAQQQEG